ncbi:unnamed protein product [Durusdinium trenchii]|uniref:Uncharacterized protein n=1 Tax=Durusdinium trenchii TaxID=1381693 RepID=A0ABP0HI69_9DINO
MGGPPVNWALHISAPSEILAPLAFELLAQKEWRPERLRPRKKLRSHMLFWLLSSILCVFAVAVIKRCLTFELKGEPLEDVVLKRGDLRVKRPSLLTPSSEKRLHRRYTSSAQEIPWKQEAAAMSV